MVTTEQATQRYQIKKGSDRIISVDLSGYLDSGELVASITTVTGSPSGLTIANEAVNDAALTILGATVAIGEACQFTVDTSTVTFASGVTSKEFTIAIWFVTDSTPAQTCYAEVVLTVYE